MDINTFLHLHSMHYQGRKGTIDDEALTYHSPAIPCAIRVALFF